MRDPEKRKEQLLAENLGNQGSGGAGGQITEDGGSEKRNGNNGESWAGEHGLNGRAGGLKSRWIEGQEGRRNKTGGREMEFHCGDEGCR